MTRRLPAALLSVLLALGGAAACEPSGCTNIFGIPSEARMRVWVCDPAGKAAPSKLSDVLMLGRWSQKAFFLSPDRQANVINRADGLEVQFAGRRTRLKLDLKSYNPRAITWNPDGRRVAFWAPVEQGRLVKRIALMDVRQIDPKQPYRIVYTPKKGTFPFGMLWAPTGDALYLIARQRVEKRNYTVIQRVEPASGKVSEVARRLGIIDFMTVSPTYGGSFLFVYGAQDGLYRADPLGKHARRLSDLPAIGLYSVAWNPSKPEVAFYFRFPAPNPDGRKLKGLYRVGLGGAKPAITQLYHETDVHSLWYSPRGTYLGWASKDEITVEGPKGRESIPAPGQRRLSGISFSADEKRLAFAAGGDVYVKELGKPAQRVARLKPKAGKGESFVGDVRWAHGRLLATQIVDAGPELRGPDRLSPRLNLPLPKKKEKEKEKEK